MKSKGDFYETIPLAFYHSSVVHPTATKNNALLCSRANRKPDQAVYVPRARRAGNNGDGFAFTSGDTPKTMMTSTMMEDDVIATPSTAASTVDSGTV